MTPLNPQHWSRDQTQYGLCFEYLAYNQKPLVYMEASLRTHLYIDLRSEHFGLNSYEINFSFHPLCGTLDQLFLHVLISFRFLRMNSTSTLSFFLGWFPFDFLYALSSFWFPIFLGTSHFGFLVLNCVFSVLICFFSWYSVPLTILYILCK